MLEVCGANCSSQYWVSNQPGGQVLLTIPPTRGGGIIARGRATDPNDVHPPIRTVFPSYAATDAMCCPSQFQDITYTWDAARSALVAGPPRTMSAAEFPGWESMRSTLQAEQFFEVLRS
jgi:hypothetical protein